MNDEAGRGPGPGGDMDTMPDERVAEDYAMTDEGALTAEETLSLDVALSLAVAVGSPTATILTPLLRKLLDSDLRRRHLDAARAETAGPDHEPVWYGKATAPGCCVYHANRLAARAETAGVDVERLRTALDSFMTERGEYRGITAEKLGAEYGAARAETVEHAEGCPKVAGGWCNCGEQQRQNAARAETAGLVEDITRRIGLLGTFDNVPHNEQTYQGGWNDAISEVLAHLRAALAAEPPT